jgi:hypothetical protein
VYTAIAAVIYASLPGHVMVKVTNKGTHEQNGLKQMPHLVVCDSTSLGVLRDTGKVTPLQFNDAAQYDTLSKDVFNVPSTFTIHNTDYEVIAKPEEQPENAVKMRI